MPRGPNNNNPLGRNQFSGFGRTGIGITINNKGIQRLAAAFAAEVRRADIPIRTAWLELASEVQMEAARVLKEEIRKGGRPQRDQRGERRQLEYILDNEPTENLAIIRLSGFQFPNLKAMNASPAGRYWRQVEQVPGRTFEMSGLFVLPPISAGGRHTSRQFQKPNGGEGSRDAVKFQQFAGAQSRVIHAWLGPKKTGGYHYFKHGADAARRNWRKNQHAKNLFIGEFRAQGLDIIARILARRAFDASRGSTFEQPRFFAE